MRDYIGSNELGFNQVVILTKDREAIVRDLKRKIGGSKVTSAKVFKIRKSVLDKKFMDWINHGIEQIV